MIEIPVGAIVWKKAWRVALENEHWSTERRVIIQMEVTGEGFIATGSDRYNQTVNEYNKGRVRAAKVIGFEDLSGNPLSPETEVHSDYDPKFMYVVGETVVPTKPFGEEDYACASGVHCFLTKKEAVDYDEI